eukprot:1195241-Prorocentrum_minimum.AAC.4
MHTLGGSSHLLYANCRGHPLDVGARARGAGVAHLARQLARAGPLDRVGVVLHRGLPQGDVATARVARTVPCSAPLAAIAVLRPAPPFGV